MPSLSGRGLVPCLFHMQGRPMRLQILVNRYNEPEAIVDRFLRSVAMQTGFGDFEVVIGDDGSDTPIPEDVVARHPFARVIEYPHRGVSATRNALFDQSTADWLMFCDIDDSFVTPHGLSTIASVMSSDCDVFASAFVSERPAIGNLTLSHDVYFLHGKAFRRGYLIENGIRWADEMVTTGDEVFLWQAMYLTDRIAYCDEPFYAWRYNPKSVCRCETDHFEKSYHKSLRSYELLIDTLLDRGVTWLAERHAVAMAYDAYCMMNRDRWLKLVGSDFTDEAESRFVRMVGKYSSLILGADRRTRDAVWKEKRMNYAGECPESTDGFVDWFWSVARRVSERMPS